METSSPANWVSESDIDNLFAENEIFFDEFEGVAASSFDCVLNFDVITSDGDSSCGSASDFKYDAAPKLLEQSKEKPKLFRSQILRKLKVPQRDVRRAYMKTVFGYLNSFDFPNLSQFMHQHCTEDFVYCCKGDDTNRKMYVPKSLTLSGVESFMSFVASIGECVPDRTYILTETIIRNRVDCGFILSKFVVSGTAIFQVQIQDDNQTLGECLPLLSNSLRVEDDEGVGGKKRQKQDIKQLASCASANTFHDLAIDSTEVEITKKDQKFGVGDFLKSGIINGRYDGVATLFLNREGKIRRFEINFSSQREANWVKIVDHKKEN